METFDLHSFYLTLHSSSFNRGRARVENETVKTKARDFLTIQLGNAQPQNLPCDIDSLQYYIKSKHEDILEQYRSYVQNRHTQQAWMFSDNLHATWYLFQIAPTKMVDGVWLSNIHQQDRSLEIVFERLQKVYVEEIGSGETDDTNHINIYRSLLRSITGDIIGGDPTDFLDHFLYTKFRVGEMDDRLIQGCIQMSLSLVADEYLPELIGYNLGYEQIALHMLITSYELKEYGIDPSYFDLHITVDNMDCGHAKLALDAARDYLSVYPEHFNRLLSGYRLSDVGPCAFDIAKNYDVDKIVQYVFERKSRWSYALHDNLKQEKWGNTLGETMRLSDGAEICRWLADAGYFKGETFIDTKFSSMMKRNMFGTFNQTELLYVRKWWEIQFCQRQDERNDISEEEQVTRLCGIIKRAIHKHDKIIMTHPITGENDTMENWYNRSKGDFVACLSTPHMKLKTLQSFLDGRMKNVRLTDEDRRFLMQWCNTSC